MRVPWMKIGLPHGRLLLSIGFDGWRIIHRRRLIAQRRNHPNLIKTSCRPVRATARATIIVVVVGVDVDPSLSLVTRKSS